MSIVITAGQRGDSPQFEPVLEKVRVPRIGAGRPRARPDRVRADKAYASRRNGAYLRRRAIRCTIPDKADQARNRQKLGSHGGRPPHFIPVDYREQFLRLRDSSGPACRGDAGGRLLQLWTAATLDDPATRLRELLQQLFRERHACLLDRARLFAWRPGSPALEWAGVAEGGAA
ncbi:hypothetical protein [Streptomyces sp. NPDC091416]|uniref:hypothetical protein n=1 Tax=Streptomyces sp. NPDC091416 TaxID=3366003 RepID=UPI0037F30A61